MKQTVEEILKVFKSNLFSINFYFERFGSLAQVEDKNAVKDKKEYILKCVQELGLDTSKPKEEQNVSSAEILRFAKKIIKTPKLSHQNFDILSRSAFLMLNNFFEYLIKDLLTYYYSKFKESLNDKDFKISLKELNEYESIEEATKSLIYKEVETLIIDLTFPKLLEHFEEKLSVSLENKIIDWKRIEEIRERRHLIVHNSSIVNKKYIVRSGNPYSLNIGDKVEISSDYFENAYNEFLLAGLLLSYNCWGNWDKERCDEAISDMLEESFEYLKTENFLFAKRICDYASQIQARNENQEDLLLRIRFNHCISLKKMEKSATLKAELKKIRVGTSLPIFKLAHDILSDKDENIIDLVNQTKALNDIDLIKYNEWPIYTFIKGKEPLNSEILEILK